MKHIRSLGKLPLPAKITLYRECTCADFKEMLGYTEEDALSACNDKGKCIST